MSSHYNFPQQMLDRQDAQIKSKIKGKPTLVFAADKAQYMQWLREQKVRSTQFPHVMVERDILKFDRGSFNVKTVGTWKSNPLMVDLHAVAVERAVPPLDKRSRKK